MVTIKREKRVINYGRQIRAQETKVTDTKILGPQVANNISLATINSVNYKMNERK